LPLYSPYGDIKFTGAVTSSQSYILLQGDNISSTKSLSAGSYIQATDTIVQTINIEGTVKSGTYNEQGGIILLWAQGNIATGAITLVSTNAMANEAGALDIKANEGGGNALFTINGTGQTNGINGAVTMSTTNGGGTDDNFFSGGLYITNGTSSSTGGITLNPGAISLKASNSNGAVIILNAENGTLTLASDGLNVVGGTGGTGQTIEKYLLTPK
jgi:hypothetical protein